MVDRRKPRRENFVPPRRDNLVPATPWIKKNSHVILANDLVMNRSLFLDKYSDWRFENSVPAQKDDDRKYRNLKKSLDIQLLDIKLLFDKDSFPFLIQRRRCEQLGAIFFPLRTKTKLIVNLGVESVFETSIALHRYWGFPIIPGSAVKGVFRHYCKESSVLSQQELLEICGNDPGESEAYEGKVVFLDAWPADYDAARNALEMDIMSPQYPRYYRDPESTLPTDDQNPDLIYFMAVKKDILFEFVIAPSSMCKAEEQSAFLSKSRRLLTDALCEYGIGAKTGSSYGYFEEV